MTRLGVDERFRELMAEATAAGDQRRADLLIWGTHYVRAEPCERCGAPLALQEYVTHSGWALTDTVLRWMEVVSDDGSGPPPAYVIRDHDADRCRALRAGRLSA